MPVGVLLEQISSREISEWMAFFSIEGPTGDARADWHAGMLASTIANANRDPKARRRPYKPDDFMPQYEKAEVGEEDPPAPDPGLLGFVQGMQRKLGGRLKIGDQIEDHQADLVGEIAARASEMIRADQAIEDDDEYGPDNPG